MLTATNVCMYFILSRRQLVAARGDVLILCPEDLADGVEFAKQLYAEQRHKHKAWFVKTAPVEQSAWNAAAGSAGDWVFVPVQWDKDQVLPYVKLPTAPFDSPLLISNEFQSRFGREPTFFGIRALNSLLTLYAAMSQAAVIDTHPLIVALVRICALLDSQHGLHKSCNNIYSFMLPRFSLALR